MITTAIFPGKYIQGFGAAGQLASEMAILGSNALVICSPSIYDKVLPGLKEGILSKIKADFEKFGRECCDDEITRVSAIVRERKSDLIVGFGGGKTLDLAKAVADRFGIPSIMVPTIASTDAPCSALSVIYTPEGVFSRVELYTHNPNVVLVDTEIIINAPVRFLVSGMGDALSTWFEAESCRASFATNTAGGKGTMTAYALAKLCFDTLMEYGETAKLAAERKAVIPAFERIVEANTLLSGLGFESGGLAAAHSIHNGLTKIRETAGCYHGEKVAFGTLASLHMNGHSAEMIDRVYSFCESVGLPTTFADLGIIKITDEQLMEVAQAACADTESMSNEPMRIEPRMVMDALKAADQTGKARKKN
ncbi:MAG: glycerol dehydrogenase [Firmicutes bacterium]|nr:glycerol dehydrogenase [Bacillota bacterium]